MRTPKRTERIAAALALTAAALAAAVAPLRAAQAAPAANTAGAPIPCGVVEALGGSVQILDSTRSHTVDAAPGAPLSCGSWLSTTDAGSWVLVHHRDGFVVRLGAATFAQLLEPNLDGKYTGDAFVLYRGTLKATAGNGSGELKLVTANARARVARGDVILIFDAAQEESQLITVSNVATFENRFESARRIRVGQGESSELSFRQLRVVPSAPKAVALAPLRARLQSLHLTEREYAQAMGAATRRGERTFASRLAVEDNEGVSVGATENGRAPAGLEFSRKGKGKAASRDAHGRPRYSAIDSDAEKEQQDNLVRTQLARKLAAGESTADRMVFPARYTRKPDRVKLEIEDPGRELKQQQSQEEAKEKKRLIDELSQIKLE